MHDWSKSIILIYLSMNLLIFILAKLAVIFIYVELMHWSMINSSCDLMMYWMIGWWINWLEGWLIDWLIDLLTNWINWLTDKKIHWLIDWLPISGGPGGLTSVQTVEISVCLPSCLAVKALTHTSYRVYGSKI